MANQPKSVRKYNISFVPPEFIQNLLYDQIEFFVFSVALTSLRLLSKCFISSTSFVIVTDSDFSSSVCCESNSHSEDVVVKRESEYVNVTTVFYLGHNCCHHTSWCPPDAAVSRSGPETVGPGPSELVTLPLSLYSQSVSITVYRSLSRSVVSVVFTC